MPERIVGNHIYDTCGLCGKYVRMTGWFAGLHLCLSEEERAHVLAQRQAMIQQSRAPVWPLGDWLRESPECKRQREIAEQFAKSQGVTYDEARMRL